ncbi:hypothetical protein Bbelb_045640 [Branchiostoma belcheri]|nr:hypothetical protein Bbelb_045640 [Branchiostoma belcheri]
MPSNKFYCGAILFFAGILLSTLTTIVVFMVAPPGNSNNGTGTEGKVMVKIKVKQGTSATPTHDQGRPLLSSAPTPSPIKTSLPNLLSTPPAVPVPVSPTGPAARNITPSSPRTLGNLSQQTTSLQTMTTFFSGVKTTLPRKINTRNEPGIGTTNQRDLCISHRRILAPENNHPHIANTHPVIPNNHPSIPNNHPDIPNNHPDIPNNYPDIPNNYPDNLDNQPDNPDNHPDIPNNHLPNHPFLLQERDDQDICRQRGDLVPRVSESIPSQHVPHLGVRDQSWEVSSDPSRKNFYDCKYDSVAIVVDGSLLGQKLYCGGGDYQIPVPPNINGSRVEVTMVSDGQDQEMGFKLEYGTLPEHG